MFVIALEVFLCALDANVLLFKSKVAGIFAVPKTRTIFCTKFVSTGEQIFLIPAVCSYN